ncbi:hypothetical protein AB4853_16460 [Bradyrhizobium sp. 1050_B9_N1_2]|uniref:hypothetical protein n=1 Tax=Bradyrhizobium sp. 1050_B9_N1_2 TaxID=3238688 RepID=UPI003EDC70D0
MTAGKIEYLPINEFDLSGITNAVNRYKAAALQADYNIDDREKGIVRIAFTNPETRDGTLVIFEIHKISRPGWIGRKAHWVIQMLSRDVAGRIERRGCVAASNQATVISKAEADVHHGFISAADFDLASRAY